MPKIKKFEQKERLIWRRTGKRGVCLRRIKGKDEKSVPKSLENDLLEVAGQFAWITSWMKELKEQQSYLKEWLVDRIKENHEEYGICGIRSTRQKGNFVLLVFPKTYPIWKRELIKKDLPDSIIDKELLIKIFVPSGSTAEEIKEAIKAGLRKGNFSEDILKIEKIDFDVRNKGKVRKLLPQAVKEGRVWNVKVKPFR